MKRASAYAIERLCVLCVAFVVPSCVSAGGPVTVLPALEQVMSVSFTGEVAACDPNTIVRFAIDEQGRVSEFAVSGIDVTEEAKRCAAAVQQQRFPSGSSTVRGHFRLAIVPKKNESGGLTEDAINRVLKVENEGLQHCYEVAMQTQRMLAGSVVLNLVIDSDGLVARAFAASNMNSPFLEWCVADRAILMTFPKPADGGIVTVTCPILFSPRK